jgi:acylphosphatase
MKRIAFVVTGRVQRVGYRRFAQRAAEQAGVSGHVRNEADGSVVGEAEGGDAALLAFVEALRRGPAISHVRSVEVEDRPAQGDSGFEVR